MASDATRRPAARAGAPLWTKDFVLISLTNLVIFAAFQMLMPVLPLYVQEIGGNEGTVGLIIGVFTVAAVAVRPWLGMEMDRRGRRGIYLLGLVIFILSTLSYNWATSVAALLLLRLVHGAGWGATTTAAGTIVADLIPAQRRGEGMGYYGMFSNLAMAIGPGLGLVLALQYSFTASFMVSTILALLALLLAYRINIPPAPGVEDGKRPALFEPSAFQPSLVMFFVTIAWGGVVSFLPLYAGQRGVTNIGLYFTVYAVALVIIRPVAGIMADRRGPALVVVPGLLLVIGSMLVLSQAAGLGMFLLAAVLNGLGFGAVQPTMQALTITRAAATRRGAANGTFFSAFDLGIGLGAMALGAFSQRWGYSSMFLAAAGAVLVGLLIFLWQGNRSGD